MPTISSHNCRKNPQFLIGFEFECRVAEEYFEDFKMDLCHFGIPNSGYDTSINEKRGFSTLEFRTEPKEFDQGLKDLEELLSYLYFWTAAGLFETDNSCGFHVNVSAPKYSNTKVQLPYFFCKFAQLFNEHEVLDTYKRKHNDYCNPFMGPRDRTFKRAVRRFYDLGGCCQDAVFETDKYRAVTLRDSSNGRIELRGFGNKNYHLRFTEAKRFLRHTKTCLERAYRFVDGSKKMKPLHTVMGWKNDLNDDNYDENGKLPNIPVLNTSGLWC